MITGIEKISKRFSYDEFFSHLQALYRKDDLFFDWSTDQVKKLHETFLRADLYIIIPDTVLVKQFPAKLARAYRAIPIIENEGTLYVGMENPFNAEKIETIESVLGRKIFPVLVDRGDLTRAFSQYYSHYDTLKNLADSFDAQEEFRKNALVVGEITSTNKIAEFFQYVLEDAQQMDASDIHIELFDKMLTVKFRVDGRLVDHKFPKADVGFYLLRYLKILANADIAQENLPIEGKHVSVMVGGGKVLNLRLSIMPTGFGFSSVIRLLPDTQEFDLKRILQDDIYHKELTEYLKLKQGMFIVSGPTGSGKSTTLYGAVSTINTPDRKIITLEDPIEIKVEGLCQVQVNAEIGYDYLTSLRAILRQDPDVIMVSEIRDASTAQAAMKAAITGHMVLSTIHTRSVKDIPLRFIDLGVDVFSLASALKLLVSQRLVRLLCPHCKEPHAVSKEQKDLIKAQHPWVKEADFKEVYINKGCAFCHQSGFSGRRIVFEHIRLNNAMLTALNERNLALYEKEADRALGDRKLSDNALRLVFKGQTSVDEALSYAD
ncbi:MAG: type II/IV secretion system protein [Alphaproteobacteria bacterium]|jgi:MSHA biogenesis protein MshE|nr:type II/IV secretion system protein [Alphaproteobacteria bacterium]